ncbi:hypothetical protein K0M31_013024 [Melipona bicolor]|uniref:Uncharacterized protein n=1 Tax=Melipona bicolor TaxID=60889 RepID=A0AA40KGJ0_9HYME|nr:hypothetical protein K0M31_013024 [Melipona bicolor]
MVQTHLGEQGGSARLLYSSLIGKAKETVKQAGWGLILIEGYAAGNNRQLAEHQSPMRLGFADNRLSGDGKWRSGRYRGVKTPSGNGQPCYESLVGVTATLLEERIRRARWKEERVSMPAGIID